jgi:putative transposase
MPSKFNPQKYHRRSIRLPEYDHSQAGAYYVTIVAWHRECLFGEVVDREMRLNWNGEIVQKWWGEIPNHFLGVETGAFIIMPNHVHGIVRITNNRRGAVLVPHNDLDPNNIQSPQQNNVILKEDEIVQPAGKTPLLRQPKLGQIAAYSNINLQRK